MMKAFHVCMRYPLQVPWKLLIFWTCFQKNVDSFVSMFRAFLLALPDLELLDFDYAIIVAIDIEILRFTRSFIASLENIHLS